MLLWHEPCRQTESISLGDLVRVRFREISAHDVPLRTNDSGLRILMKLVWRCIDGRGRNRLFVDEEEGCTLIIACLSRGKTCVVPDEDIGVKETSSD